MSYTFFFKPKIHNIVSDNNKNSSDENRDNLYTLQTNDVCIHNNQEGIKSIKYI